MKITKIIKNVSYTINIDDEEEYWCDIDCEYLSEYHDICKLYSKKRMARIIDGDIVYPRCKKCIKDFGV